MIQNKFKYSVFLAASLLLVSCSGIDSNQIEIVSSNESTSEDINIADDATTEVTDISVEKIAEEVSDAQSGDFYYIELDYDKEESIDIGNDGRMDSLLLNSEDGGENVTLIVNNQNIKLISRENPECGEDADAFYIHRKDVDYLITDRSGYSNCIDVTLYKWANDSFEEIDRLEKKYVYNLEGENGQRIKDEIYEDYVVLGDWYFDSFGTWICCKNYTYDENGFFTEDKMYKIHPISKNQVLTLKRPLTLYDENGNEQKTLETGQKIVPYEADAHYRDNIDGKSVNTMSFTSETGEFLGYITYEFENCSTDEDWDCAITVNGVSEDELFEGIMYFG